MRKNGIVLAVVCLLVAGAVYQNIVSANQNKTEEAAKPGFLAPAFELTGRDGQVYRVGGEREKPVVLNFWASWCAPCHEEAPDLQKIYEEYKDQVDLYAINVTTLDTNKGIERFIEKYGLTFPVPLDVDGVVTSDRYRVDGYPTSFIVDRDGIVVDAIFGLINPDDLRKKLDKLLERS